jgi:hypothetical protein
MTIQGGVTIPLFQCVFNADGTMTHWVTSFERELYFALPHLYLVCLAEGVGRSRKLVGSLMVKTSLHHDEAGFADAMNLAMAAFESLRTRVGKHTSLLPARIGLDGEPPSEAEFLRLSMQQHLKFSSAGTA